MSTHDVDSLVRTWLESWAKLRDLEVAAEEGGRAYRSEGPEGPATLVIEPDEASLAERTAAVQGAERLFVFTRALPVVLALGEKAGLERETRDVETLMVTPIQDHDVEAPLPHLDELSYEVSNPHPGVFVASLKMNGEEAAVGTVSVVDEVAIFDRVRTVEQYRRRGLASLAMQVLVHAALEEGVETGLLAATSDGRKFYEELGWDEVADIVVLKRP